MAESQSTESLNPQPNHSITIGRLTIDLLARQARLDHQPVHLALLEFEFLAYLARHAGRAVSFEELSRSVWRYDSPITENNDSIKGCVHRLREVIEPDASCPRYIIASRGFGYMMPTQVDD
jgi:DNA-binding response OmpR family regulator